MHARVLHMDKHMQRIKCFPICSPLNLQGSIRHSSSSLSSHTSSEAGNLAIMTDGLMGEHPEEALHMQVRLGVKLHAAKSAALTACIRTAPLHIMMYYRKCTWRLIISVLSAWTNIKNRYSKDIFLWKKGAFPYVRIYFVFRSRAPPPPAWAQFAPTLPRLLTLLPQVPEVSNTDAEITLGFNRGFIHHGRLRIRKYISEISHKLYVLVARYETQLYN